MNINHEYWHLRENDPGRPDRRPAGGAARIDIKFSFGNCLDDENEVKPAAALRLRAGDRVPESELGGPPRPTRGSLRWPAGRRTPGDLRRAQPRDARDLLAVPASTVSRRARPVKCGTGKAAKGSAGEPCTTRSGRCGCRSARYDAPFASTRSSTKTSASSARNGCTSATCR